MSIRIMAVTAAIVASIPLVAPGQEPAPAPAPDPGAVPASSPAPAPAAVQPRPSAPVQHAPSTALAVPAGLSPGDDRVITMPSAETLPRGVWSFSDYEIMLVHLSYGITDDVQVSCFMTLPVFQVVVGPSVKWRFFKNDRVRLALMADGGLGVW